MIMQFEPVGTGWIPYILMFIVPGITGLVYLIKKGDKGEASSEFLSYEVKEIKKDIDKIDNKVDQIDNKSSDALRQIDIVNLRIDNLERHYYKEGKGAI